MIRLLNIVGALAFGLVLSFDYDHQLLESNCVEVSRPILIGSTESIQPMAKECL